MRVRCRGRILRVVKPRVSPQDFSGTVQAETKIGVAVRLEGYEYLPESAEASSTFPRVSSLHPQRQEESPPAQSPARPVLG
jgi:hypothetical protein